MALFRCSALIDFDAQHIVRASELADRSAGYTAPHPNSGCVIARGSKIVGEGYLYGQGARCAELQAVEKAGELAKGATAYLNLEPGDCHGDDTAVTALAQSGVSRILVGLLHPLKHLKGKAISALRSRGTAVEVLGEGLRDSEKFQEAFKICQLVNAPLIYRSAHNVPFSVLKYAMTLDGKIAASTGHAAWVSSSMSRKRVFAARGRSDAVIVGGNTVRRDNPRLTTRQEGSHLPVRVVMSRTLNLPQDAHLWDVTDAHTIVMTQKGARKDFQKLLCSKGVEVVEFEFLTPRSVMDYCYSRGFLSVLWECGGTLSAPALSSGLIHKVISFVAPKIIGGVTAPTPVGDLGMVEMTQALNLLDVTFEQIGPDMLISGFLKPMPNMESPAATSCAVDDASVEEAKVMSASSTGPSVISFFKSWDPYGALNNFSPHPIKMPDSDGVIIEWKSVEHYYQAQKFRGIKHPIAEEGVESIKECRCPEEAARLGRRLARERPDLVRSDWERVKIQVMYEGLEKKFCWNDGLRRLLMSTKGSVLVECSPNDEFWGCGRCGNGANHLGRLLMKLRTKFLEEQEAMSPSSSSQINLI